MSQKDRISKWIENGIDTPETIAYRAISIEELVASMRQSALFPSVIAPFEGPRKPPEGTNVLMITLRRATIAKVVKNIKNSLAREFYTDMVTMIEDGHFDEEDPAYNVDEEEFLAYWAQDHAIGHIFNTEGIGSSREVWYLIKEGSFSTESYPDSPVKLFLDLAAKNGIGSDQAISIWEEAKGRKGVLVGFNREILEYDVNPDSKRPGAIDVILPLEGIGIDCISGIQIFTPKERQELFESFFH